MGMLDWLRSATSRAGIDQELPEPFATKVDVDGMRVDVGVHPIGVDGRGNTVFEVRDFEGNTYGEFRYLVQSEDYGSTKGRDPLVQDYHASCVEAIEAVVRSWLEYGTGYEE